MQLYGGMWHAVVANNTALRAQGFIIEGLNHGQHTYMPCYFVETLHNRVLEGVTYDGSVGGFAVSGYYNASQPFTGAMAAAIVYRGNVGDNSAFSLNDAVTDVLYEDNALTNSDTGLTIRGNTSQRVFLRNNNDL